MIHLASVFVTGVVATALPWRTQTAVTTIGALERTGASSVRPHNLLNVMLDDESGLCSEGVWHNSWLGVSRVLAARQLRALGETEAADRTLSAAQKLGDSLLDMSFDGVGFRRRSPSGIWEDVAVAAVEEAGEDAEFYRPCTEHRCASNGAAAIFFSLLAEEAEDGSPEAEAANARSAEVFDAFTGRFFDKEKMRFRREGDGDGSYWRAVDQAVGCLASLRMAKVGHRVAESRAAAGCAADSLLREFGYALFATEGQPPGPPPALLASQP